MIAFLEGDCIARPGWIRNRVAAHRAGHEAVASTVAVANPEKAAARATAFLCYENRLEGSPGAPPGYHVRTGSRSPVTSCGAPARSTIPSESKRTLSWPSASVSWGSTRGRAFGVHRARGAEPSTRSVQGADLPWAPAGPKRHSGPAPGSLRVKLESRPGLLTRGGREDGPARARAKPLPVAELEAVCDGPARARRNGPMDRPRVDRKHRGLGREQYRVRTKGGLHRIGRCHAGERSIATADDDDRRETLVLTFDDGPSESTSGRARGALELWRPRQLLRPR